MLPFSSLTSWSWKVSKILFCEVEGTAIELWKIENDFLLAAALSSHSTQSSAISAAGPLPFVRNIEFFLKLKEDKSLKINKRITTTSHDKYSNLGSR